MELLTKCPNLITVVLARNPLCNAEAPTVVEPSYRCGSHTGRQHTAVNDHYEQVSGETMAALRSEQDNHVHRPHRRQEYRYPYLTQPNSLTHSLTPRQTWSCGKAYTGPAW